VDAHKDASSKYRYNLIELKNKVMSKKKKKKLAREHKE
jgi:hypothetical protein